MQACRRIHTGGGQRHIRKQYSGVLTKSDHILGSARQVNRVGRKGATKVSLRSRRDRSRKEFFGRVDAFSRAFAAKTFTHAKTIPPATQARRKFSSTDGRAVPVLTRPFLKGQANAGF